MHFVHQEQSVLVDQELSGVKDRQVQRDQLSLTFPLSIKDIQETISCVWTKQRMQLFPDQSIILLIKLTFKQLTFKVVATLQTTYIKCCDELKTFITSLWNHLLALGYPNPTLP